MLSNLTTKEKILNSALTLFSEKGYDGVGVDLIAEKVGLKGPSIYKHFKGKEEILEILIGNVENYYEMNFGSEIHPGKMPSSMDELIEITKKRIQFTMHDETIRKTRRILMMEQFRNQRIAKLATRYTTEGIQGIYQKIFEEMMDKNLMRRENSAVVSMLFVAPITLWIHMCDREPEREQEALQRIDEHLAYFVKEYAIAD